MKKKLIKELKQIADQLPVSYYEARVGNGIMIAKINHLNRIKKAYKRDGVEGIKFYLKWLRKHNEKLNKKYNK